MWNSHTRHRRNLNQHSEDWNTWNWQAFYSGYSTKLWSTHSVWTWIKVWKAKRICLYIQERCSTQHQVREWAVLAEISTSSYTILRPQDESSEIRGYCTPNLFLDPPGVILTHHSVYGTSNIYQCLPSDFHMPLHAGVCSLRVLVARQCNKLLAHIQRDHDLHNMRHTAHIRQSSRFRNERWHRTNIDQYGTPDYRLQCHHHLLHHCKTNPTHHQKSEEPEITHQGTSKDDLGFLLKSSRVYSNPLQVGCIWMGWREWC